MSKYLLKPDTIKKGFKSIGFTQHYGNPAWMTLTSPRTGASIHATIDNLSIELKGARWIKAPNVHIVSYWSWPKTTQELTTLLENVKTVYSELCQSF